MDLYGFSIGFQAAQGKMLVSFDQGEQKIGPIYATFLTRPFSFCLKKCCGGSPPPSLVDPALDLSILLVAPAQTTAKKIFNFKNFNNVFSSAGNYKYSILKTYNLIST